MNLKKPKGKRKKQYVDDTSGGKLPKHQRGLILCKKDDYIIFVILTSVGADNIIWFRVVQKSWVHSRRTNGRLHHREQPGPPTAAAQGVGQSLSLIKWIRIVVLLFGVGRGWQGLGAFPTKSPLIKKLIINVKGIMLDSFVFNHSWAVFRTSYLFVNFKILYFIYLLSSGKWEAICTGSEFRVWVLGVSLTPSLLSNSLHF